MIYSFPANHKQKSMNAHKKTQRASPSGTAHNDQPTVPTDTYPMMDSGITSVAMAVLSLMSVLYGCETAPVKIDAVPEVARPTMTEVPVREKCSVELPVEPAWVLTGVESSGLFDFYRRALAELVQRRQYEAELRAAAAKCQ